MNTRETILEFLKGDKVLWIAVILISVLSVIPVYSASSNLEYIVNNGTTTGHVFKHIIFVLVGIAGMRLVGMFKFEYLGKLSGILLMVSIGLLVLTIFSGQTIQGASASRWLKIPGTPFSFQPSTFAYLMLIIYLCRFLTKKRKRALVPLEIIFGIFAPILIVFGLVAKDNGSTAMMILMVSFAVLLIGQLNWKYIIGFVGSAAVVASVFLFLAFNTDVLKDTRVHTWKSRIETFTKKNDPTTIEDEAFKAKNYQVMQAKAAIVHGGITGRGPGKSALKQMLPQSASDFIFAIIVEEYGLLGAVVLIGLYLIILIRIVMIASKTNSFFGSLLVISLGIMFFLQLAVNIGVAVNIIPVTGQPLPLISYGGTSMLVTFLQLGIILNISTRIQILDEEGIGNKQDFKEIDDIA